MGVSVGWLLIAGWVFCLFVLLLLFSPYLIYKTPHNLNTVETVRGPSKNKNKKQNKQTTTKKNQKGGIYTNLARKNNENSIGSPVRGVSVKRSRRANRSPSRWLFFLLLLCVQSHMKTRPFLRILIMWKI